MKKVIVLGASSNIGHQFIVDYASTYNIVPVARTEVRGMSDTRILSSFFDRDLPKLLKDLAPDYVVNCIAMGNVDLCEVNQAAAYRCNVVFVESLIKVCNEIPGCVLVHFSSNAIYDGENPLYSEESSPNPLNFYGVCKANADDLVRRGSCDFLILRPISIYGQALEFQRKNPIHWMLNEVMNDRKVSLVNDVYTNMLFVEDAARALHLALEKNLRGEFNLSSIAISSLFDIGQIAISTLGLDPALISAVSSEHFKKAGAAKRPRNTSFDNTKASQVLGITFIEIEEGLSKMIELMGRP
jgi:dTDP-4-dehydrorhamnose reductase